MSIETYYAPVEKADSEQLKVQIETVTNNPLLDGLLHTVSGLIAVLNENRQIISLNESFMRAIGVNNPDEAFGLRHGAVLKCIHGEENPAGCGTTEYCATCGAAVAIVSSMKDGKPVERICSLAIEKEGIIHTRAFLVKCHPLVIENVQFILLFLQDVTIQEQRAALERTFFHDINNLIYILTGTSELLLYKHPSPLTRSLNDASQRIQREVELQRCLLDTRDSTYCPTWLAYSSEQIMSEMKTIFQNHPLSKARSILYTNDCSGVTTTTDLSLVTRVLSNMLLNALEASESSDVIAVKCEKDKDTISFAVWNPQVIPQEATKRIFSRNFSTKSGEGRGVGTFSMKLFGEKYLGGKVDFSTAAGAGTTFRLTLQIK